jgi:hypothetical protein
MSDPVFVVVDIGCLECHNPSALVGIYRLREEALATGATPAAELSTEGMDSNSWSTSENGGPLRVMFEAQLPEPLVYWHPTGGYRCTACHHPRREHDEGGCQRCHCELSDDDLGADRS